MRQSVVALTLYEGEYSIDPKEEFQSRPGRVVHETFLRRVLPALEPVTSVARCRYEALPLGSWLGEGRPYPRLPQNPLPRYDPTSAEIYADLYPREQGMLVNWGHLVILLSFQANGRSGILATTDNTATFCFMKGLNDEVFLIRVFRNSSLKTWYIRAWSFQERVDRGWSRNNLLLLPFNL